MIVIEIRTDADCFNDCSSQEFSNKLGRILRDLATTVKDKDLGEGTRFPVLDSSGEQVGEMRVTD